MFSGRSEMDYIRSIRPITVPSGKSMLVIVDQQKRWQESAKRSGPTGRGTGYSIDGIIPRIARVRERSRSAGIPVIHVQSTRSRRSPEFSRFGRRPISLLKGSREWEIVDELRPSRGEFVVEKRSHDCFFQTNMDSLLKRMHFGNRPWEKHVIITGAAIATCVYHAAIGFHLRNYRVCIPIDCVAGQPEGEAFLFHLTRPSYSYNISLTRSDILEIS